MLASVLVDQVGTTLNDMEAGNEHVRWTVPNLLNYLTEAIAAIAQAKPSVFTTLATLDLGTGSTQQLPAQYSKLLDVHFNFNADGTEGAVVLPGVYSLQDAFQKPICRTDALIQTYVVYPGSDRYYTVKPSVPQGLNYIPKVQALVVLVPQAVTSTVQSLFMPGSAPELYQGALADWMLMRCYGTDQESASSFERSQAHLRAFQQYLGIGVQQVPQRSPSRKAA